MIEGNCGLKKLSISALVLLMLILLNCCAGVRKEFKPENTIFFTPITAEPTNVYHPGKIVWHDLVTTDAAAAKEFYGQLFGWSFKQNENYIEIFHDGKKIGGIVSLQAKGDKKFLASWVPSISVPDVDSAVDFVKSKGGSIVNGPVNMPGRGRGALIKDPMGAYLVVLHALHGDPADSRATIGEWLWNEMWTDYRETATWFYKRLGQYDSVIRGPGYSILISEGKWRAGVREVKQKAYSGRWVPVVRVENPSSMLEKVKKLGGIVLLKPGQGSAGSDAALIADNTGALLILQRWTYPERKGTPS